MGTRTAFGYDVHSFCDGNALWLCGISIPHDYALKGHSDADVALHALTDALLGTICAEDIGFHFPPNQEKWRNVSSYIFVNHAKNLIAEKMGRILHCDLTIICESPKIGPHRTQMREKIAEILEIDLNRVSVKATTTEGLGFTGRKEGIAVQAVVTVELPYE